MHLIRLRAAFELVLPEGSVAKNRARHGLGDTAQGYAVASWTERREPTTQVVHVHPLPNLHPDMRNACSIELDR
jgi:hypothetical protein